MKEKNELRLERSNRDRKRKEPLLWSCGHYSLVSVRGERYRCGAKNKNREARIKRTRSPIDGKKLPAYIRGK